MEERKRVRLDPLCERDQAAELFRRFGDAHGENVISGLCRGDQVARGADSADAGSDPGHLPHQPSLAELLEAAEFIHVKAGVLNAAAIIKLDRDLCVP